MDYRRPFDVPRYRASAQERLEHLATFVESLLPGQITFACWYGHGRGCAIGMAITHDPYFLAQGLQLNGTSSLKDCRPTYNDHSDWLAIAKFFDLSVEQARDLFDRSGYGGNLSPDPARIAKKLRHHLVAMDIPALAD